MLLTDFDYELPPELIARHPAKERSASRLLVVDASSGTLEDRRFTDLPSLLDPGDLLVFNDTRVLRARLHGRKESGGRVEILIERTLGRRRALAQVRASKSPKRGGVIELDAGCMATVRGRSGDLFELEFSECVDAFLERHGDVPLPPYLGRDAEAADADRYQTIYADKPGAVAAPTAGLHFDERVRAQLRGRGVGEAYLTLHVGAGTFQRLRQAEVTANRLHSERVRVDETVADAVTRTRVQGHRVVAVGTTSVRALETASAGGTIEPFEGETDLFIVPGYRFRAVDLMLTNFHLPRSSLLMLVAAFAGRETILAAYAHAIAERYRFFSYGDAMLIRRASTK